jgi:hypothetical protein
VSTQDPAAVEPPGGEAPRAPLLRVVRGEPGPEEIAALTAVLTAVAARSAAAGESPSAAADRRARAAWVDRAGSLRGPLPHGAGAWRAAGRQPGTRTRAAP